MPERVSCATPKSSTLVRRFAVPKDDDIGRLQIALENAAFVRAAWVACRVK
jgi:hypothetical protein